MVQWRDFSKISKAERKIAFELVEMLNSATIPSKLLEARMIALLKKTSQSIVDVEDTRPIMLRSHLTKILENAIKEKAEKHYPHL